MTAHEHLADLDRHMQDARRALAEMQRATERADAAIDDVLVALDRYRERHAEDSHA